MDKYINLFPKFFLYYNNKLVSSSQCACVKGTSETSFPDKQTHMAISESLLRIYLSRKMNTCILLDLERQVLYLYENIWKNIGICRSNKQLNVRWSAAQISEIWFSTCMVSLVYYYYYTTINFSRLVVSLVIPLHSCWLLSPTLWYDLRCIIHSLD